MQAGDRVNALALADIDDLDRVIAQGGDKQAATLRIKKHVIKSALDIGH
jgi:hypothetical protein